MRVMCTGRVDPSFILRAFGKGADGVFIGGCHLNECNYITHGNFYALRIAHICKKLMALMGIDPRRLSIEFISGAEGNRFAELMNDFSNTIEGLGPLGEGEGIQKETLRFRLAVATKLVPYLKLLERERFRVRFETVGEYEEFFRGEEFDRLFRESVQEKFVTSEIVSLLEEKPLPTGEIARILGLTPSEVSRHLSSSSRHGLVRYDAGTRSYALS